MGHRKMKQSIAELTALLKRGDLGPEQEQAIQFATLRLKQLKRLKKASNQQVFDCVAEISERLVNALCRSNKKL